MSRKLIGRKGSSLIEVMLSAAILAAMAMLVFHQRIEFKKFNQKQSDLDTGAMIVETLMDQIRSRVAVFPKSFVPTGQCETAETPPLENWTIAWSGNFFGKRTDCLSCDGKAIYYICQARVTLDDGTDHTSLYTGLYRVRILLYHPSFTGGDQMREYRFMVASR
jgi:hypothetical protein